MTRLTLRLPFDLSQRLRDESRKTGVSLNQTIIATLRSALTRSEAVEGYENPLIEQVEYVRTALGDLVTSLDLSQFPSALQPGRLDIPDEPNVGSLPKLHPPLSVTILEERSEQG